MPAVGPALPATFIPRPRVHADLVGWRALRLIYVVSPTGYGKTTLAASWLADLAALPEPQRPSTTWLALEPAGIPIDVALRRITEPLRPYLSAVDEMLERHASGRLSSAQFAQALCVDVGQLPQHFVVVIDDFHLGSDPPTLELIQCILDAESPNLHLVLLSRTQPSLKIGRLLLRNAALLLDERQLRFDHEEFLAFSRVTRLGSLDDGQLAAVEARCEGWVAAMQLIALSLPNAPVDAVDALLGPRSGRLLLEHLEAEVFAHLPAALQQFLVDVAPLPFLSPELIAAATSHDKRAAARFLQLALDANVFLTAYTHSAAPGSAQVRCRFHPLFRELLLRKLLDAVDPSDVEHTVQHAAGWLAAQGEVDVALALLLPEHPAAAAAIVAAHLRPAIFRFDLVSAQRWLDQLPAPAIDGSPQLAVDAAWLAFFFERSDLPAHIARARSTLAAQHADDTELAAEIGALEAFSLFAQGRRAAARAAADAAANIPHLENGMAAGYLDLIDVLLRDRPEDLDDRLRRIHRAVGIFQRLGFAHAALDAVVWPCALKRRYGDTSGIVAAHENALAMLRHFRKENSAAAADSHFIIGKSLYLMDCIAEARAQFERAVAIAERADPAGVTGYHALLGLQLCDLVEGYSPQAYDPADDARRWAAVVADHPPILAVNVGWMRLLRDIQLSLPERCRQTADSFGISPAQLTADSHELLRLLVLGGAVVGGSTDAALDAQLREFQAEMLDVQNVPLAAYAGALCVIYLSNAGNDDDARTELKRLRAYVDQYAMPRLLSDFPQCTRMIAAHAAPVPDDRFGLSRQELRILHMLADDHTNKEIAAALSISLPTVKTHLQHIFRKLGVHDRAAAVRRVSSDSRG